MSITLVLILIMDGRSALQISRIAKDPTGQSPSIPEERMAAVL
jgi:hypothetical protein